MAYCVRRRRFLIIVNCWRTLWCGNTPLVVALLCYWQQKRPPCHSVRSFRRILLLLRRRRIVENRFIDRIAVYSLWLWHFYVVVEGGRTTSYSATSGLYYYERTTKNVARHLASCGRRTTAVSITLEARMLLNVENSQFNLGLPGRS